MSASRRTAPVDSGTCRAIPSRRQAPSRLGPRPRRWPSRRATLTGGVGLFDHSGARSHFRPRPACRRHRLGLVVTAIVRRRARQHEPGDRPRAKPAARPINSVERPRRRRGARARQPSGAEGARSSPPSPALAVTPFPASRARPVTVGPNLAGVASRPKIAGGAVTNTARTISRSGSLNPPAESRARPCPMWG